MIKSYNDKLKIVDGFNIKIDGYIRLWDLSLLFVVIYKKTLLLVRVILD